MGKLGGCVCTYLINLNYLFFMRAPIGVDCASCLLLCLWCTFALIKVQSLQHLSSQQHVLLTSQSAESQTRSLYLWNVTFVSYLPEEQFCTFWKYSTLLSSTFPYASTPGSLLMFLSKYLFLLNYTFVHFVRVNVFCSIVWNSIPQLDMFRSRVWELPYSAGWR